MITRKDARELAFQLIFEKNFREESVEEIIATAVESREIVDDEFARNAAVGTFNNIVKIDEIISRHLQGWTLNRVSKVALSVMRLSVYEMLFSNEVPASVSINEAVEIAKKYGGEDDPAYINGVLGSISRAEISE